MKDKGWVLPHIPAPCLELLQVVSLLLVEGTLVITPVMSERIGDGGPSSVKLLPLLGTLCNQRRNIRIINKLNA